MPGVNQNVVYLWILQKWVWNFTGRGTPSFFSITFFAQYVGILMPFYVPAQTSSTKFMVSGGLKNSIGAFCTHKLITLLSTPNPVVQQQRPTLCLQLYN
jgi:hypothetical protein